mmetsp:Transcript_42805/g.107635  ORF Transcript_42805/g.107635 Transcript_42805/m.107635 type:complete len:200 (+) Transcript_42805:497-1096(+)
MGFKLIHSPPQLRHLPLSDRLLRAQSRLRGDDLGLARQLLPLQLPPALSLHALHGSPRGLCLFCHHAADAFAARVEGPIEILAHQFTSSTFSLQLGRKLRQPLLEFRVCICLVIGDLLKRSLLVCQARSKLLAEVPAAAPELLRHLLEGPGELRAEAIHLALQLLQCRGLLRGMPAGGLPEAAHGLPVGGVTVSGLLSD